jgi:hypothetical protein
MYVHVDFNDRDRVFVADEYGNGHWVSRWLLDTVDWRTYYSGPVTHIVSALREIRER